MGRLICLVAIVAGLVGCGPGEVEDVEVVAWNLQFFPGRTKQPSVEEEAGPLAAAQDVVAGRGADVLCLLEMKTR